MTHRRVPLFLMTLALFVSPLLGAEEKKPLTNADVIRMVNAELPEKTILLAIQQGPTNFDTSVDALIDLNKQGVSQAIQNAMQKAQTPKPTPPPQPTTIMEPDSPVPGLPKEPGVYYQGKNGWVALREPPMPESKMRVRKWSMFLGPGVSMKPYWQYAGAHAELQISEPRPTFYVKAYGWDERTCILAELEVKEKKAFRRVPSTKAASAGIPKKFLHEIEVKRISSSGMLPLFMLTPKEDLEPGEYLLGANPMGLPGYEFSITLQSDIDVAKLEKSRKP